MIIGILKIELFLSDKSSLKGKRQVLKSLKDRIKNKFNVSICEIDHYEKWQKAALAIANIGNSSRKVNSNLTNVFKEISQVREIEILDYQTEII